MNKLAYKLHSQYMIEIIRLKDQRSRLLHKKDWDGAADIAMEINTIKRCADKLSRMFKLKFEI